MSILTDMLRRRGLISAMLLPVLFAFLFYALYFSAYVQNITVRLHMESDVHDTMVFYLPDQNGRYSEQRSRRVRYPDGTSGHEFTIPAYPPEQALRFDPGQKEHDFRLLDLSLERFGVERRIGPDQLASHIRRLVSAELLDHGQGVSFRLQAPDPQMYLSALPRPGPQWQGVAAFLAMLVLLLALGRWLASLGPERLVQIVAITLLVLLFAPLKADARFYHGLIAAALYAVAGYSAIRALAASCQQRFGAVSVGAAILSFAFAVMLWTPLEKTMTPEFLQRLTHNVESAWAKKSSLNDRMKAVRDVIEHDFVRHFAYRDWLINLNARFKIFVLGFSPTSKAILGRDGMFFEGYGGRRVEGDITRSFDNITDYMGQVPFSRKELEAWRVSLEERYYWLKEQGIDYVFALAPTKALIFPEKLPERIYAAKQAANKPTRYEQLMGYLKQHSIVPVVDLRSTLLKAKKDAPYPLFYRTDFHWTYYGSFLAYRAIVDAINQRYPQYRLAPARLSEFRIDRKDDWVHINFMRVLGLDAVQNRNETYLTFYPKPDSRYAQIDSYLEKGISDYTLPEVSLKKFGSERLAVREIDNPQGKVPMMVVIGDSFIEKTLAYFSGHSQRTVNFRAVTSFPAGPYATESPDIVVQEILNMYILQSPPVNPPQVREARKRALSGAEATQQ